MGGWSAGLRPDGFNVERKADSDDVRLTLESDRYGAIRVVLDQSALLSLIAALHRKVASKPLAPISLDRLRPGALIAVQGISAQRQPDGSAHVVLLAELDDRVVTVPLSLDPETVRRLAAEMIGS